MPKNNSKSRTEWRRLRAEERDFFGRILYRERDKTPLFDPEAVNLGEGLSRAQRVKTALKNNPMWREVEDRRWATEPKP